VHETPLSNCLYFFDVVATLLFANGHVPGQLFTLFTANATSFYCSADRTLHEPLITAGGERCLLVSSEIDDITVFDAKVASVEFVGADVAVDVAATINESDEFSDPADSVVSAAVAPVAASLTPRTAATTC
jgi:hypothetical protein